MYDHLAAPQRHIWPCPGWERRGTADSVIGDITGFMPQRRWLVSNRLGKVGWGQIGTAVLPGALLNQISGFTRDHAPALFLCRRTVVHHKTHPRTSDTATGKFITPALPTAAPGEEDHLKDQNGGHPATVEMTNLA